MRPIRILHSLCRVGSGGVEMRVRLLLKHLPPDRFEHRVICQDAFGALAEELPALGCEIVTIGAVSSLLDPRWYAKAIPPARAFRPDIIHGGVIEGNALANVLGLALPRARVISEETSDPRERKRRTEHFLRALFLRSDAVVGVSPPVSDYLRDRLRVPSRKLHTISNGVMAPIAYASERLDELRCSWGLEAGDEVIGAVGRVEDNNKRFSDLIAALPAIRSARPRVKLLIVGEGSYRPHLQELADRSGVREAVVFAGYMADPRPAYLLMDLFVLPSATEAFGLVLVEAMHAGVPIIATRVGGIPSVLGEGKAGLLIPPFEPEAIAVSAVRLLSDPREQERLRQAGIRRAASEFSAERYAARVGDLYTSLVGRAA